MARFADAALLSCALIGVSLAPHGSAMAQGAPQVRAPIRVTGIEAKLFYGNTGRFSSNLFEMKQLMLWNVVIGEGSGVEGPSENTLVIVRVGGPPKAYVEKLRLRIVAKTAKRVLAQRDVQVGTFNSAGNWYTPLMLNDTGCEPIEIAATLGNVADAATVVATLPFGCGE